MRKGGRRVRWKPGVWLATAFVAVASPAPAADLAPASAAQAAPTAYPSPSGWRFEATIVGWATNLDGIVGVVKPPLFDVKVRYSDVMPHSEALPMGGFVAKNDTFVIGADYGWTLASKNLAFPLFSFLPEPQISVTKTKYQVGALFAGYRLAFGPPELSLYATVGARYNNMAATFALTDPAIGYLRSKSLSITWLDPTIGLLADYRLSPNWSFKASGDIGGFDVGSTLTSQGSFSVAYNWTTSISTSVGYRALYTDCLRSKSNGQAFRYATTVHGPFAALTYAF